MGDVVSLVSTIKEMAEQRVEETVVQTTFAGGELSITQATNNRRLEDFISNASMFLNSEESTEWVWQIVWTSYHGDNYPKLIIQPLYAREFMLDMVWCRASYYIISSATLLNIPIFIHETGLDKILKKDEILHINIPSTFPPENRPIIDRTNGKLTMKERNENFVPAVRILERILDQEEKVNVAVHCHSYQMSVGIQNVIDKKYHDRLITHTPETRQEALETWKNSRGKVFLSVSFEEGQNWVQDICRAQVLFKVPFLDTNDKRVEARLERHNWNWYYNEALKTTIQAYGRAVRGPDDYARFYVIDSSFVDLIRKCRKDVPAWIREVLPEHWKKLIE
jgi:Rad3-related DNA helicase